MERRLCHAVVALAIVGGLASPTTAAAKEGAMFSPMLMSLASGHASRLQLYVMSTGTGPNTGIPAPAPGSVPIVILRRQRGGRVLRFTGTPLDGSHRSVVRIEIPASRVSQRWMVSVQAGGHVYPDRIDSPVVSTASVHLLRAARRSAAAGSDAWWPVLVAAALVAVGAALVVKRTPWQARS
jgi:hypothetical protein